MDDVKSLTMGPREWTLLIALSILWGGSFFFLKILVAELPPFTVVLGRVGIAALALHALLLLQRNPLRVDRRTGGAFLVMGIVNNAIPFSLIAIGEMRIASGLAAILNATTPLFTVLAAHALTRDERLNGPKLLGVACGVAGVAVLIGPGALRGLTTIDLVGVAACLAAALSYAFAGIYGRRFRGIPPLTAATGQLTMSTLVLAPLALLERPWTLPSPSSAAWASLAAIALLSTALAFVLYFRILATAGATNLLLVTFLLPISALALGATFLHEAVTPAALAGMALIGLGLVAIDGRAWRALRQPRRVADPGDDYVI